jgi:hypothetical protein
MLFAISMLFSCKSLKINMLVVEAAGVEPDIGVENAQLIDSGIAWIGMNTKIAKSTVRSLYGDFPEFPQLPNSTFGRPLFGEKSILKCVCSIAQVRNRARTAPRVVMRLLSYRR